MPCCVFQFFFFFSAALFDQVNCEQCICALFTNPQILFFSNFFIKNGSHDTIHTFKNYFVTVISVSVFSFSKNKLNPNGPYISTNLPTLTSKFFFFLIDKISQTDCVVYINLNCSIAFYSRK